MEADVFPLRQPGLSDQIDGAIGERSMFHQTFGYYVHGVSENTAALPHGWRERLIKVQNENTGGGIGWCLEPHDSAASKLAAGREKDVGFVRVMLEEQMISRRVLEQRIGALPLPRERRNAVQARLERLSGA